MDITTAFENFEQQLEGLAQIIKDCDEVLISDEPSEFVENNVNFLTRSFLVNLCSYLESYFKDALELMIFDVNEKLTESKLPYNLIRWTIEEKPTSRYKMDGLLKKEKRRFEALKIEITKKDLDQFISGNPHRTKELFEMFGIQLDKNEYYQNNKSLIGSIIGKRNTIIHHNDLASNLSNSDVLSHIEGIKSYALEIDKIVEKKITNREYCTTR